MIPCPKLFLAISLSTLSLSSLAQSEKDILKDAVDPLNYSKQRTAFLRVAGPDSEISQNEFELDLDGRNHFAQIYDQWPSILKYDKNKNNSIDWFEALAYRKALRNAVLDIYDTSKDKKLKGPERDRALKDMATKKFSLAGISKYADASKKWEQNNKDLPKLKPIPSPGGKLTKEQAEKHEADKKAFLEKHDTNGDGKMDKAEWEAYGKQRRENWIKEQEAKMDTNGDGNITYEERLTHHRQNMENGRKNLIKWIDKDKDGVISQQEKLQATQDNRDKEHRTHQQMLARHFDADKDGKLSDEEAAQRNQLEAQIKQADAQRLNQLLPKYDLNNNGRIDSIEAFNIFNDKQEELVRNQHNGEQPDKSQYVIDGKFDFEKWMLSDERADHRIMTESADFGELVSQPADNWLKVLEQEKTRANQLKAGRENARQVRERALRNQLKRNQ